MRPSWVDYCEWLAFMECYTPSVKTDVLTSFRNLRHKEVKVSPGSSIILCEVEEVPRGVVVFFNGDSLAGYRYFFQYAESRLGFVSLIRVGNAMDWPTYDKFDVELMQDALSVRSRSEYYVGVERKLVRRFIRSFLPANHTEENLQRIVEMCCLGPDHHDRKKLVMLYLYQWVPSHFGAGEDAVTHWVSAIPQCNTSGNSERNALDGCNLLVRVMGHLVYLEELNPTPRDAKSKLSGQRMRTLNLGR